MQDFAGKVAVITGAASGIGRAMAERFGNEGMKLVLADIEAEPLAEAIDSLRDRGSRGDRHGDRRLVTRVGRSAGGVGDRGVRQGTPVVQQRRRGRR